jgi:putative Mn2+ efflux pump MntP
MRLDTFSMVAMGAGLAMDAFAVAISMGVTIKNIRPTQTARLALAFGGFQGLMPVVGYLAGRSLSEFPWVAAYDHWIAFTLLAFLGGKMIYEARFLSPDEDAKGASDDPTKSLTLIVLAFATSIDALAVGASLALLHVRIALPSLIIGVVTAVFAVLGAQLGQRFGQSFGKKVEIAGGLALVAIGLRILIDHLMNPTP